MYLEVWIWKSTFKHILKKTDVYWSTESDQSVDDG